PCHGADVLLAEQPLAAGIGGDLDAGGRRVRQPRGPASPAPVPAGLPGGGAAAGPACAGRLVEAPPAGARRVRRRHPAGRQSMSACFAVDYVGTAPQALLDETDVLAVFGF